MSARKLGTLFRTIPPHYYVAGSAWGGRIVTAATGLLMVRLLTQSLGTQQYAAYAVLGGLQGWYTLMDLGIGSSLQNHISERRARGEQYEQFIASSALLGLLYSAIFAGLLLLSSGALGSAVLRNFDTFTYDVKKTCFAAFGLMSLATCVGGISYRIWFAEQKGYLANLFPALASVISFLLVVAVSTTAQSHSLFWMLVAGFGPSAMLPVAAFIIQVARNKGAVFTVEIPVLRPLFVRGLKFWLIGLMGAGVLQIDYIIMSQYLFPRDIVTYNLTSKVFLLFYFVYSSLLTALWPVCAEASANNDWATLAKHVRRTILLGVLLIISGTVLFSIFRQDVLALLSPKQTVDVSLGLVLLFGVYYLVRVWCDVFVIVLQSMSYLKPFALYVPVQAVLNVSIQIMVIRTLGVRGVLIGLIGSYMLTAAWLVPWLVYRKKAQMAVPAL